MTDHDPTPLGAALRERVRDELPDVEQLVRLSTASGARLRRRRRIGAALAGIAGAAAVVVGIAALQGSDPVAGQQEPIASDPTSVAPTPTQTPDLPKNAAPVSVDAAGWTCNRPMDEKFMCGKGDAYVVVNWRDAADHDAYLDPGKADTLDGVHTFVSDVHGAWFATVAPAKGTTQAEVDEVGHGLVWTPAVP